MALTDTALHNARPAAKPYKLYDEKAGSFYSAKRAWKLSSWSSHYSQSFKFPLL